MYNMQDHKAHDRADILDFIGKYPFAFLTACDAAMRPVVTQVPLLSEERDGVLYLSGHIMRQTDHHKALVHNPDALIVFTSPNTYVSASWYTNPHKGSTWNYMSVHARGKMRFPDEAGAAEVMKKLTLHFEKGNTASPTIYANLPESYTQAMMKAIAIFEMEVTDLDTVFKLSQDRDEASYYHIISKLKEQGGSGVVIAQEMEERAARLFGAKGGKSNT
jgi:transcriptional regulator